MSTSNLAIRGGTPAHAARAPKYPRFAPADLERVREVLETGPMQGLSKGHPVIAELEGRLAAYHGVEHCLAASSGHGALHSALIGLEITGGDEVITSPYSWGASVSCILHNGAVPTFADVAETSKFSICSLRMDAISSARTIALPRYSPPRGGVCRPDVALAAPEEDGLERSLQLSAQAAQPRPGRPVLDPQGNRVKESCGDEACEEVVVPCSNFALEAERVLTGGSSDQVVGHVP